MAAYQDRWGVTSRDPLGPLPDDDTQRLDYERARAHLAALTSTDEDAPSAQSARGVARDPRSL